MRFTIASVFLLWIMIFSQAFTQSETNTNSNINGFGIGINAELNWSQLPNDNRIGISANTPFFLDRWVALRFEADYGLIRGIPVTNTLSNSIWANYYAFKAGIVVAANRRSDIIRPFIETGFIYIIPTSTFTSDTSAWGIYGLFGLDVSFPGDFSGYFFEIGGTGLLSPGGYADQYKGLMPYATGLNIVLGWRFYL